MNSLDTPAVSITIPVYNTSKYLRKCLDSLASQTLKDIEFIIVDDGSTDSSGEICDEYASMDSRFKVIHQKNGGLASARQTGLDVAQGEYVIVCDSDDWVEPNMYEVLYKTAKETDADIVICNYFAEYNDGRSIPHRIKFKENDGIVDNHDLLVRRPGASWIKLVKRSLFLETKAYYEPGISMGEDALIMYKLIIGSPKIVQIDTELYHYRRLIGENSYTNSLNMNQISQMVYTYHWLNNQPIYRKDEEILYGRAINVVFAALRAKDLNEDYLKDFIKKELTWNRIRSNKITSKSILAAISKIIPLPLMRRMLKIVYPYIYK